MASPNGAALLAGVQSPKPCIPCAAPHPKMRNLGFAARSPVFHWEISSSYCTARNRCAAQRIWCCPFRMKANTDLSLHPIGQQCGVRHVKIANGDVTVCRNATNLALLELVVRVFNVGFYIR